jgi:hypothetical protein
MKIIMIYFRYNAFVLLRSNITCQCRITTGKMSRITTSNGILLNITQILKFQVIVDKSVVKYKTSNKQAVVIYYISFCYSTYFFKGHQVLVTYAVWDEITDIKQQLKWYNKHSCKPLCIPQRCVLWHKYNRFIPPTTLFIYKEYDFILMDVKLHFN